MRQTIKINRIIKFILVVSQFLIHSYAEYWDIVKQFGSTGLNDAYSATLIASRYNFTDQEVNTFKQYFGGSTICLVPTAYEDTFALSGNCQSNTQIRIYYYSTQVILQIAFKICYNIDAKFSNYQIQVNVNSNSYYSHGYTTFDKIQHSVDQYDGIIQVNSNSLNIYVTPANIYGNQWATYIQAIYLAVQLVIQIIEHIKR
ncbi:hypothetical protein ABPG73_008393 [Tetrahymena malaccensis]